MLKKQKRPVNIWFHIMPLFILYFLVFQLAESAVNDRAAIVLDAAAVNGVYAAGLFCTASGYILFGFLYRHFNETARKWVFVSSGTVYLICGFIMYTTGKPEAFLLASAGCLLAVGYIGGFSHYILAITLRDITYTGRVTSIAIAVGIGVQYVVQNILSPLPALLAWTLMTVLTILSGLSHIKNNCSYLSASPNPVARFPKKHLYMLMAVVALMSMIITLDDNICQTLHAQGLINLFGQPLMFYAGSVLLSGYLADRQNRAYLPLATVCVVLISGFAFAFLNQPDTYWINACLLYIYSGFYVSFFTVMFLDVASKSSRPELWAGMGRVVRSYTLSVATVPFICLYDFFGILPMMVLSVVLSAGCLVLFFTGGMLSSARTSETPQDDASSLELFSKKYSLTARETEVLAAIVDNDRGIRELAEELHISERTAYRYITSIYEKTGASSRLGLSLIYYGKYKKEGIHQQSQDNKLHK